MSCHLTRVRCTRADADAAIAREDVFPGIEPPPVLVATETADGWELQLYTEGPPAPAVRDRLAALAAGPQRTEQLAEADWVTLSQAGLAPVDAGRFRIEPGTGPGGRPGQMTLRIGASLAFGTGQHATTRGCLLLLDRLRRRGRLGRVLDLGTGSGILALAATRIDRRSRVFASDIDPVAIGVARANARRNQALGVRFAVAAGLDAGLLRAGARFDLVLANILAPPLLALAAALAQAVRPGGRLVLAGLLEPQRAGVEAAYRAQGFRRVARLKGEWPVLLLARRGSPDRRGGPAAAVRASRRGRAAALRSAGSI